MSWYSKYQYVSGTKSGKHGTWIQVEYTECLIKHSGDFLTHLIFWQSSQQPLSAFADTEYWVCCTPVPGPPKLSVCTAASECLCKHKVLGRLSPRAWHSQIPHLPSKRMTCAIQEIRRCCPEAHANSIRQVVSGPCGMAFTCLRFTGRGYGTQNSQEQSACQVDVLRVGLDGREGMELWVKARVLCYNIKKEHITAKHDRWGYWLGLSVYIHMSSEGYLVWHKWASISYPTMFNMCFKASITE